MPDRKALYLILTLKGRSLKPPRTHLWLGISLKESVQLLEHN